VAQTSSFSNSDQPAGKIQKARGGEQVNKGLARMARNGNATNPKGEAAGTRLLGRARIMSGDLARVGGGSVRVARPSGGRMPNMASFARNGGVVQLDPKAVKK
jgi:hypothetical protein